MSILTLSDVFTAAAIEDALSWLEGKRNASGPDGLMLSELRSWWKINGASILVSLDRETWEPGIVRMTELLTRTGKKRKIALFNSVDRLLLRCLSQGREDIICYLVDHFFTYSEKSVSLMSPLRASVSCMAKAAVRQWRVCPPVPSFR